MDILNLMKTFIAIAEDESFVIAANKLDISSSVASRQIATLEKHLGARLFHRSTRAVSLTSAGQDYLERVQTIISDIQDAENMVGQNAQSPNGKLRISAPLSFGIAKMGPLMAKFIEKYPNIEPTIELEDKVIDLASDRIDIAIRIASSLNESLIVRKICKIKLKICASKEYLSNSGFPQTPYDLTSHKILSYSYLTQSENWFFKKDNQELNINIKPIVKSNNGDILAQMAVNNAGIVIQPDFIVEKHLENGSLQEILSDWEFREFYLYAVFLSKKFMPSKIRAFIDFLASELVD